MFKKTSGRVGLAAAATMIIAAGVFTASCASEPKEAGAVDYTKMTPEALAEYLIFEAKGFKLDHPVQEGGVARQRLVQDELQKICTPLRGQPADSETATKVIAMARESMKYPEGGIKLGDWQIGRELAWSGYGWRAGHRDDDHSTTEHGPGGNCYNCHQLATDRTGGTIGPSLTGYGKTRGTSDAILKYAYEVIYNPHSYYACTNMPRFGANGMLTTEQISHIMAYLFDPESPVNN
jgi:sulfur-oxidizing protein SoxX